MRRAIGLAILALILSWWATAQGRPPFQRPSDDVLWSEAIALPGNDSAMLRIDLHLRIDYGFFIPVRTEETGAPPRFLRRGELLVELQDSTGRPVDRAIRTIELTDDVSERDIDRRAWYQTTVSLEGPPGRYQFLIELDDSESDRKIVDRSRKLDARTEAVPGPGSSVMLAGDDGSADSVWLENFGGDVLFGAPASLLIRLPSGNATTVSVSAEIRAEGDPDDGASTTDTLSALAVRRVRELKAVADDGKVGYALLSSPGEDAARYVILPLRTAQLPLRRYVLVATIADAQAQLKLERKFRTVWPQMPFSLRDVDGALEALSYIVPEETLDSLHSGDFRTRRRHLEEFWRARDQTPGTVENEVMVQYYRRVDYARRHFGTLRQPDGFRTDRGRVYVLHGRPTTTERELDPRSGFREIWTYRHLGKRFIFVDQAKTGNYILTATEGQ